MLNSSHWAPTHRSASSPSRRPTKWSSGRIASHFADRAAPISILTHYANDVPTERTTDPDSSAIQVQVELLSGCECSVLSAAARLAEMITHSPQAKEGIRFAGGVRSAVFLLKLSQTAGNLRITNAASLLLLRLARDSPRVQDDICALEGIPCLMDVILSIGRGIGARARHSSGSELLEMTEMMTEAAFSAAMILGMLAERHTRAIARAGRTEACICASQTSSGRG